MDFLGCEGAGLPKRLPNPVLVTKVSFRLLRKMLIPDTGIFENTDGARVHPWGHLPLLTATGHLGERRRRRGARDRARRARTREEGREDVLHRPEGNVK